jgi:hypothetical protein
MHLQLFLEALTHACALKNEEESARELYRLSVVWRLIANPSTLPTAKEDMQELCCMFNDFAPGGELNAVTRITSGSIFFFLFLSLS